MEYFILYWEAFDKQLHDYYVFWNVGKYMACPNGCEMIV
jgi:hypothetical protein